MPRKPSPNCKTTQRDFIRLGAALYWTPVWHVCGLNSAPTKTSVDCVRYSGRGHHSERLQEDEELEEEMFVDSCCYRCYFYFQTHISLHCWALLKFTNRSANLQPSSPSPLSSFYSFPTHGRTSTKPCSVIFNTNVKSDIHPEQTVLCFQIQLVMNELLWIRYHGVPQGSIVGLKFKKRKFYTCVSDLF